MEGEHGLIECSALFLVLRKYSLRVRQERGSKHMKEKQCSLYFPCCLDWSLVLFTFCPTGFTNLQFSSPYCAKLKNVSRNQRISCLWLLYVWNRELLYLSFLRDFRILFSPQGTAVFLFPCSPCFSVSVLKLCETGAVETLGGSPSPSQPPEPQRMDGCIGSLSCVASDYFPACACRTETLNSAEIEHLVEREEPSDCRGAKWHAFPEAPVTQQSPEVPRSATTCKLEWKVSSGWWSGQQG